MKLNAKHSRQYWLTLMANVVALILDAEVLLKRGSAGRARSLMILAQEELARAYALYVSANDVWNAGKGTVNFANSHVANSTNHVGKIQLSDLLAGHLGPFWGDYDTPFVERDAKRVNLDKQAGFYVAANPGAGGQFHSPLDIAEGPVSDELARTAQITEMALILDNSRINTYSSQTDEISANDLHTLILHIAHPQEIRRHPFGP